MYFNKIGLVSETDKEKFEELKEYVSIEASIEYVKSKVEKHFPGSKREAQES